MMSWEIGWSTLRLPTPPMETPDPPSDTPGASKQVVLTPHDIPRSLRVIRFIGHLKIYKRRFWKWELTSWLVFKSESGDAVLQK